MFREGQAPRPTKSEWDSAVLEGWCDARGCCPFAMVVGMERFGATGGASSSPTKSERDSAVLEGYAGRRVVVQSLRLDGKKFAT